MSLLDVLPIVIVLGIIGSDVWVYTDARARAEEGDPVVFSVGSIQLDSPEVWAVACLVLWVVCLPLYLASRKASS